MSNFDTIKSITDNLQSLLKGLGLNFSREIHEDELKIPAGSIPSGQIFYQSETFEDAFNLRPEYIEASFRLRIVLRERNPIDMMREQQKWTHTTKDALTVNALNIGDLITSKLVSLVATERAESETLSADMGAVNIEVIVRYREG